MVGRSDVLGTPRAKRLGKNSGALENHHEKHSPQSERRLLWAPLRGSLRALSRPFSGLLARLGGRSSIAGVIAFQSEQSVPAPLFFFIELLIFYLYALLPEFRGHRSVQLKEFA